MTTHNLKKINLTETSSIEISIDEHLENEFEVVISEDSVRFESDKIIYKDFDNYADAVEYYIKKVNFYLKKAS